MAEQIRITPDQMDERAVEYRAERDKVGDVIVRMDHLLDALMAEFEGKTSDEFYQVYTTELRPGFVKAQDMIEEIAKFLNDTATRFRIADGG